MLLQRSRIGVPSRPPFAYFHPVSQIKRQPTFRPHPCAVWTPVSAPKAAPSALTIKVLSAMPICRTETCFRAGTADKTLIVLPGKPLEQRRPVRRDRRARCVEHHPNERVVAHQADGIEDALLAELRDGAGIGGVADAAVLQQLRAEVIQRFLILRHAVRPAAVADRLGDLRIEATLDR